MKKINESELLNRVARLREKVLAEMGGGGAAQAQRNANVPAPGTAAAVRSGQPAPGKAAAPAGTTAPAPAAKPAAKPDPTTMELQKKLIAAGAKIKADGIMGPATRAAQQQFPNVTTQPAAAQAVGADINSADKAPAAPAGDAAKNPVGTTNASTAIPTGG